MAIRHRIRPDPRIVAVILFVTWLATSARQVPAAPALDSPSVLTFEEVCRRAKASGTTVPLLDLERRFLADRTVPWASPSANRLADDLLALRMATAANEAARTAALTFCRVRDCDARLAVCAEREKRLADIVRRLNAIESAGGVTGVDRPIAETQANTAGLERLTVAAQRATEWRTLANLVGMEGEGNCGEVPKPSGPIDADKEIESALTARTDLRAAEMMRTRLCRETLPVARSFVAQVDASLGQKPPPTRPTGRGWHASVFDTGAREIRLRSQQLDLLREGKRNEIRMQIDRAVAAVDAAMARANVTRAEVDAAILRAERLAESATGGGVTALRTALSEVGILEARLIYLDAVARVDSAIVDLQAARQGL